MFILIGFYITNFDLISSLAIFVLVETCGVNEARVDFSQSGNVYVLLAEPLFFLFLLNLVSLKR